ncbi:HxlR family transcriptional regulator [Prauserella shujinwangii]|uniref:HxlR family transcriptional regulator n=1 Tax=Prauserella shujinwangii TaxID=1453103 RepID=A0A2T0LN04_9PSEU|nr:winged helix-turn-helix transcriptional regulator [Prauserella shujinwangii]PRX44501.1 HxlR family transcriptional regulator [Prauserella shujinwangii]
MAKRQYGQFCGLARAADLVGERWALLIVRDLLVRPRRFTDLKRGLPRIPTNVLSNRLKELEGAGVVHRKVLPRPDSSVVYELTEYGADLRDIVLALGRWGARTLGEPGPDDIVTPESLVMALRATFRPDAAADLRAGYELRVGDAVLHALVDHGTLRAEPGPLPAADLSLEAGPAIRAVLAGELTPAEAVATGKVRVTGDAGLFDRFAEVFRI